MENRPFLLPTIFPPYIPHIYVVHRRAPSISRRWRWRVYLRTRMLHLFTNYHSVAITILDALRAREQAATYILSREMLREL